MPADRVDSRLRIRRATPAELPECFRIRHVVFVLGQGVPLDLERDAEDDAATHWIAHARSTPVGTARARIIDANGQTAVKAERVAVLDEARRMGVGRLLKEAIEAWAREQSCTRVLLNAQADAIRFYESLDYRSQGEPFMEAGIVHRAMWKPLA